MASSYEIAGLWFDTQVSDLLLPFHPYLPMCFSILRDREGTEGFPESQPHSESAEEAEPQSEGHQEEERVSLKTAGWVQTDVLVDMATWTHLETPAPPLTWPLMGCHALSVIILFSFLQSCTKVKSHQEGSQGFLSSTYLRKQLKEYFSTESHPVERPLPGQGNATSVA